MDVYRQKRFPLTAARNDHDDRPAGKSERLLRTFVLQHVPRAIADRVSITMSGVALSLVHPPSFSSLFGIAEEEAKSEMIRT